MRAARVQVGESMLRELLHAPEGAEIFNVQWDGSDKSFTLFFEDPALPQVPEGARFPLLSITVHTTPEGAQTWDWNYPQEPQ